MNRDFLPRLGQREATVASTPKRGNRRTTVSGFSKYEGFASRATDTQVKSITVVVACYNAAPEIASLSSGLLPHLKELQSTWKVQLLCIDDGSTDDTLALLRKHFEHASGVATDIVSHSSNWGLSEAMRTALVSLLCILAALAGVAILIGVQGTMPAQMAHKPATLNENLDFDALFSGITPESLGRGHGRIEHHQEGLQEVAPGLQVHAAARVPIQGPTLGGTATPAEGGGEE